MCKSLYLRMFWNGHTIESLHPSVSDIVCSSRGPTIQSNGPSKYSGLSKADQVITISSYSLDFQPPSLPPVDSLQCSERGPARPARLLTICPTVFLIRAARFKPFALRLTDSYLVPSTRNAGHAGTWRKAKIFF